MRKFTKEISALLASVAVGTVAVAGTAAVSSAKEQEAGERAQNGETTTRTCEETTIGTMMAEDPTTTEEYEMTEPIGTMMAEDPAWTTTEEYRMTDPIGTYMAEDPVQTTTVEEEEWPMIGTEIAEPPTEEEFPPTAGIPLPPDDMIEPTTEEIPPLQGDVAMPDGDIDGDGDTGTTDVIMLQRWLLGVPAEQNGYFWAADLNLDGEIDVFDLGLMKRRILKQRDNYIRPDVQVEFGTIFSVMKDKLTFYAGPSETTRRITYLPKGVILRELGYQEGNDEWLFTEYNGQFGWIKLIDDYGNRTVIYEAAPAKPVIYLYPEQETDVHVELELTESELNTTYPKYNNGWDVTAYPDGTLLNKADGTHHRYLFWDSVNCSTRFDFSEGFCVAGCDTEQFLKEKLTYMGLTENEMNEFIVYWLPLMEHNAFNLIAFQDDAYTDTAKLTITPAPDTECRIFMAYIPLEEAVEIAPQELPTFERSGFTVVEWGGVKIGS